MTIEFNRWEEDPKIELPGSSEPALAGSRNEHGEIVFTASNIG